MATIECKLAMCISRLVEFELLLELKIEQKHGTSLVKLVLSRENPRHRQCADRTSVCPSYIFQYQYIELAGTAHKGCLMRPLFIHVYNVFVSQSGLLM
jgi:hypothetical protein